MSLYDYPTTHSKNYPMPRFSMACFRRSTNFRQLRRYLVLLLILITVTAILECYHLTLYVEPDSLHPLTVRWQSVNLHQIIRSEIDTTIISPHTAAKTCKYPKSHSNRHINIIIIVSSSPANQDARKAIRETWANKSVLPLEVTVLFILGRTLDEYVMQSTRDEARMYEDMIIEDFIDSYENLTVKSLFSLKWVSNNCEGATHLLKTDDDMLILVDNLLETLSEIKINLERTHAKRDDSIQELRPTIFGKSHTKYLTKEQILVPYLNGTEEINTSGAYVLGHLYHQIKPIRDKDSKWFLPYTLYPKQYFPDFISGTAYVIATGNGFQGTIKSILMNSLLANYVLPLEDVFITGIVANQAMGIPLLRGNNQFHKSIPLILPWAVSELATCFYYYSIAIHGLEPKDIKQGWKHIREINRERCTSLKGNFHKTIYSLLASFELSKPKS